jgi:hypothetical protein
MTRRSYHFSNFILFKFFLINSACSVLRNLGLFLRQGSIQVSNITAFPLPNVPCFMLNLISGETPSSWIMDGVLDFLTGPSACAQVVKRFSKMK